MQSKRLHELNIKSRANCYDSNMQTCMKMVKKGMFAIAEVTFNNELSVAQLVGLLVAEPAYPGSSPRHIWVHAFSRIYSRINVAIFSVVGDVPVDSDAPVVTSSISRFVGPTQFFEGSHRGRVWVRAFIGLVCARACKHLLL